jgi:hypothetical protein
MNSKKSNEKSWAAGGFVPSAACCFCSLEMGYGK